MAAVTRDGDGCVPLAELDINPALRATCQRRLAAALEGRAMTARKLAEFSGVSEAVISRTLHGQRTPTLDAIVRLSLTLNVSADYLLGLKASPQGDYRTHPRAARGRRSKGRCASRSESPGGHRCRPATGWVTYLRLRAPRRDLPAGAKDMERMMPR